MQDTPQHPGKLQTPEDFEHYLQLNRTWYHQPW